MKEKKPAVVLSLSGGMDSSTLLLKCIGTYENVIAVSFDYGQKHKVELEKAQDLVNYINYVSLNKKSFNPVKHRIIKLDGLSDLLNSTLVEGGDEVPEGHYEEENMKDTVVPNRNKIFSSIVQAIALSESNRNGKGCDLALGIHAGDHAIYPDCRKEFRNADMKAFKIGNWNADNIKFFAPYLKGNKKTILQDGIKLCKKLGLDFNEVYYHTNTSYKPVFISTVEDEHSGMISHRFVSDYKSASSVERIEAFMDLGLKDPIEYADQDGIVEWEQVVEYVSNVLKNKK